MGRCGVHAFSFLLIKRIQQILAGIFIPLVIGIGLVIYPPASAKGDVEIKTNIIPNAVPNALPTTKIALQELATEAALKHGLNVSRFLKVIDCETAGTWDPSIQSRAKNIKDGGRELSFGLAQIHLPAHTNITKDQATDPTWAIAWMANEWENGRQNQWSCWKNIYS